MIADTCVVVDAMRGNKAAIRFLDDPSTSFALSVVTIAEIYAGMRKSELPDAQEFLSSFPTYPIDDAIARKAGEYLDYFSKSRNFGIADALIAATATLHGEQLATRNVKDFPMLDVVKPY